jgi:N-glycosylase/DNA lyase
MEYFFETDYFNPALTLTGGQAFRWTHCGGNEYSGVAGGRAVTLTHEKAGFRLLGASDKDLPFWKEYFDTDRDYKRVIRDFKTDPLLKKACKYAHGLRLLRQEPFETLISFIISQCNNIPRIRGIIKRLCEGFGEEIGDGICAFPDEKILASSEEADLSPLRAGFRARYIIDAARKVQKGEINLNALYGMGTGEARHELMKISGVGEKVADCVLLFAYGKSDAFPKDVWVRRVLEKFYPEGLPDCVSGNEGLAQQYLFEYIRGNYKGM